MLLSLATPAHLCTYLNSNRFSLQDAQSQLLAEKGVLQSMLDEAQQEIDSLQVRLDKIFRYTYTFYRVYIRITA